jgi:hypothetical protein
MLAIFDGLIPGTAATMTTDLHISGNSFRLPGFWIWWKRDTQFGPPIDLRIVTVNYLLLITLTIITPAAWLSKRFIRCRRDFPTHCASCRYNLTGNTSGTCPECGAPVPQKHKTPPPLDGSPNDAP